MKLYSPQECMDFWQKQRPVRNGKTIWESIERCIECAIKQDIIARELSRIKTDIGKHDAEIRATERVKTIDEIIKTLAKSEDTILSDKQYYELLKMKGGIEWQNLR